MSNNFWKHPNADEHTTHKYENVKDKILNGCADYSGINNPESYLWSEIKRIWYPMVQVAEDVDKNEKAQKFFDAVPELILDSKGRMWDCDKDAMSGSLMWNSHEEGIPSVYATPYFDGCDNIPVAIISRNGECIKSFEDEIEVDAMISLCNALGKIRKPRVDISEHVSKMFYGMQAIADNWDDAGLTDRDDYPHYLPSFDEVIADLKEFFKWCELN